MRDASQTLDSNELAEVLAYLQSLDPTIKSVKGTKIKFMGRGRVLVVHPQASGTVRLTGEAPAPTQPDPKVELTDLRADELIAHIKTLDPTDDALQQIIANDTRKSVVKAARKRIES